MKRALLLILIFVSTGVVAQNNYMGKNDPEATALLKRVSARYKNFRTLQANISLVVENAQGKKLTSQTGELFLKGNKYYLRFNGNTSFSDGSNIYNYDKSAGEIQITKINPKDNTLTPQRLFTDFYQKDYLYKLNDDIVKNGRIVQEVELTPLDKTQPYFKVLLEIDKATRNITGARIFEKAGNRYLYTISSSKPNASIADSKFVYNKKDFPGAEVIDLR
ncbi:MAG: outer membrane lipoprotein carrier protein LolA [Chitinophagaceae bacterium]|nr:outer membrane lipoprotein carrier protein LolA [Chitinophagaceae bacterium]